MDEPVCTISICNELGCLSQDWGKHAGTDIIDFIFHKDKPNGRRATCVKVVCNIRPHKTETCRIIITSGGNFIYDPGEVITPTSYLTTMKLHVNRAISEFKSRYMCMYVKYFYLNNHIDRVEYITIKISTVPQ